MSAVRGISASQSIKHASIRDAGGLLKAERVHVRDASGLKTVFSAMAATAAPASVRGYGNSSSAVAITTPAVSVTVEGGVAPFSYAWTRTDADPQAWTITAPSEAATGFQSTVDPSAKVTAKFICTVTDDTGATAATAEVTAGAINLGGGL